MQINVTVLTPTKIYFQGKASNIILPGEQGVFEVLPFHKRLLSRLVSGALVIDDEILPIKRGVVKVDQNKVTVIVEEANIDAGP